MSKDQWIRDYEQAFERFDDGESDLSTIGSELEDLGFYPHEIRKMLSEYIEYPIPKGYFGKENALEAYIDAAQPVNPRR